MAGSNGRTFSVYERVPAGSKLPRWCHFFLIDEAAGDVFVPAKFLDTLRFLVYLSAGEATVYPSDGPVKLIRGRPFVSARAIGEDDPRFEEFRVKILGHFRNCPEVVESFD